MDPNATWEGTWPPKSTPKYFLRNHIWNEAKPAENLAWTSGNRWDPSMGWQLHTSATLRLNGFDPPQSIQKGMLSRKIKEEPSYYSLSVFNTCPPLCAIVFAMIDSQLVYIYEMLWNALPKMCKGGCMAKHCVEKLESEKPREREAMRLTAPNMVLSVKQPRVGFVNH